MAQNGKTPECPVRAQDHSPGLAALFCGQPWVGAAQADNPERVEGSFSRTAHAMRLKRQGAKLSLTRMPGRAKESRSFAPGLFPCIPVQGLSDLRARSTRRYQF